MTPDQAKQIVVNAWRAFSSRDSAVVGSFFEEDAEWLAPEGNATARALNFTNHMVGRSEISRFIAYEFHRLFVADVNVQFLRLFCEGSTVILEERMRATLASGNSYENDYCFFFELRNGRIWRVREYMDTQKGAQSIFSERGAA